MNDDQHQVVWLNGETLAKELHKAGAPSMKNRTNVI